MSLSTLPAAFWAELLPGLRCCEALRLPLCCRRFYFDLDFAVLLRQIQGFRVNHVAPQCRTLDFCIAAIKDCNGDIRDMRRLALSVAREMWCSEVATAVGFNWPDLIPEFLPEAWRTRPVALKILTGNPWMRSGGSDALAYFQAFRSDREVVLRAVESYGGPETLPKALEPPEIL
jgi:hypothetical protein